MMMMMMNVSKKRRRIGPWATLIISLFLTLVVLWSPLNHDDTPKLRIHNWGGSTLPAARKEDDTLAYRMKRLVRVQNRNEFQATGYTCQENQRTEQCITKNQVQIETYDLQTTIYITTSDHLPKNTRTMKPYTLRDDDTAMKYVTPVKIIEGDGSSTSDATDLTSSSTTTTTDLPDEFLPITCQYNHTVPAVVFSSGGFTLNMYHELNEFLVPLFLTTRHFNSEVQFFITDYRPTVIEKYRDFLRSLSNYDPIDATYSNATSTHCFPHGAVIGLSYHGNVAVEYFNAPPGHTMDEFRRFVYHSFNLNTTKYTAAVKQLKEDVSQKKKPVLVLISRERSSRVILNQDELIKLMKSVGFKVHVSTEEERMDLNRFTKVLSECNVLVGVHGSGLSNAVFLPQGAVLLQLLPLGLKTQGVFYYGDAAINMGLKYLSYVTEPEESSLYKLYGPNDPIIASAASMFTTRGYTAARALYIDGQNVTVNLNRFNQTLVQVLEVLRS